MSSKTSVLVIGGTSGIGKGIKDLLGADEVSKSTGFDINHPVETEEYDVIVLNSYGEFTSQLKTLLSLAQDHPNAYFIVIASIKAYSTRPDNINKLMYSVEKSAINNACLQLNEINIKACAFNPGYVNTDFNKNKDVPKLSTEYIAKKVQGIIEDYENGIIHQNITLGAI